jgi:uncharacterized membrane protein YczE
LEIGEEKFMAAILVWSLGGMVGPGTIISAVGLGFCIQTTFKLLKFDAVEIRHETIKDTYQFMRTMRPK